MSTASDASSGIEASAERALASDAAARTEADGRDDGGAGAGQQALTVMLNNSHGAPAFLVSIPLPDYRTWGIVHLPMLTVRLPRSPLTRHVLDSRPGRS